MADSDFKVTQKQAAEFLQVSTKTISRYRKKGLPFKMILNPVTGKQEVRFRQYDLERWFEGRQLLATFGQEVNTPAAKEQQSSRTSSSQPVADTERSVAVGGQYLEELLTVYKEQILVLREQLEDMRGQLARRDRQIDDLMRMMVGLQLEYKPEGSNNSESEKSGNSEPVSSNTSQKMFSRDELSDSILRLRQRGKGYGEIARGLNQINVATLSGKPFWTEAEVQGLLPSLVNEKQNVIEL